MHRWVRIRNLGRSTTRDEELLRLQAALAPKESSQFEPDDGPHAVPQDREGTIKSTIERLGNGLDQRVKIRVRRLREASLAPRELQRAELDLEPVKEHLLLTRYDVNRVQLGEMLAIEDVLEILAIPLLGVIPESESVLRASNLGAPVILDETSPPGQAYGDAVDRFLGEQVAHRFVTAEKQGFFQRLLRRTA